MYSLDGIGDASIGMDDPILALNDSPRREQQTDYLTRLSVRTWCARSMESACKW
jgi:hypothetical protein